MSQRSPFLDPGPTTSPGQLAIALLARDNFQPVALEKSAGAVDGYAEGATLNTRFGSFPHSTLLDVKWGSQVRASDVDTGSRGRKRKLVDAADEGASTPDPDEPVGGTKKAVQASSGFIHILRPTPELWTTSLPHRTQVVYTPDYSYVLHRIRARPGTRIIEAGAGSGSFTHASVRAVYNGYPSESRRRHHGKVFSFEYHEPRYEKMKEEITGHGLDDLVQMTHRDVYREGFMVDGKSPQASAVFLDLPAPWEALHHLSRRRRMKGGGEDEDQDKWVSPLDPTMSIHICTFSPCIEQVTRTVEELRRQGWTDIDMVEVSHKKINTVREKVGLNFPNERGFNQSPADVGEAIARLRDINKKTEAFNRGQDGRRSGAKGGDKMDVDDAPPVSTSANGTHGESNASEEEKSWVLGRLVHRTEGELKTHTSYLVFAILPPEWSEEDEARAMAKWPCGSEVRTVGSTDKVARKQEKRELLETKRKPKKRHYTQAQALGGDGKQTS